MNARIGLSPCRTGCPSIRHGLVQDLGKTLDYLETRGDIDVSGLAYMGLSRCLLGPGHPRNEDRFRVAIFIGEA